ncbi:hypothetical protein [Vibrio parahaemolyticus]|uniref:hypothetical protein n=1 Tax=Vibrio parahaemolyticus TaxID=670 RepID=UPI000B51D580|nr:hypothetical protein [Vibrio parahaemolyticus]EGQ8036343.1 hypothetical protein [Vibrio parahaemolyticus]EGQ8511701.1 hypothetical protein [Vibrio parahaemolyticus]EGR2972448.1 hypothetical protein [Vibrio parahaemolyticus]EGR3062212.1 hypothetical protein [Vibrio parahaemolyticus]EGR3071858.1 hypothetical protein [Vibrio parahaemolyticus]
MQSKTDICNGALLRIGHTERISNVDTERSLAAENCREFWDVSVKSVLEGTNPSFARRTERLNKLSDEISHEYSNVYLWPDDCLVPRSVITDGQHKTRKINQRTKIDFIKSQSSDGLKKTIVTDADNAYLIYTTGNVQTHMFDNSTCIAISLLLGANLALSLKKDTGLAQQLNGAYMALISKVEAIDGNSQSTDVNYLYNFENDSINSRLS